MTNDKNATVGPPDPGGPPSPEREAGLLLGDELDPDDTMVLEAASLFQAPTPACLVAMTGVAIGRRFPIDDEAMILGRSPEADVRVDEPGVSRKHAIVIPTLQGGAVVEDLNSKNGTLVNGRPVAGRHVLRDGEQVQVGRAVFKYLEGHNVEQAYHDEVFRLTATDELTQVFNRRYLFETAARELDRALRMDLALAFVIFDVDHFKRLNDTYGHDAGDRVLAGVAARARAQCRGDDIVARYGGEEFAVLLPGQGRGAAIAIAERIRSAIADTPFDADGVWIPATVSLGVAVLDEVDAEILSDPGVLPQDRVRALVRIADGRLYEAKGAGRNRVVAA